MRPTARGGQALPDGTGVIVIRRDRETRRDRLRAYKIMVDDRPEGSVRRGGHREIPVPPGPHAVRVCIDWCSSPVVRVDVTAGHHVVLDCGPGGMPDMLAAITVGRERYLRLEQAEPVVPPGHWAGATDQPPDPVR